MTRDRRLVVASQNPGKCREFARILDHFDVRSLSEFDPVDFPEEGGAYAANARAKAQAAARVTGLPCIADDSGLEVDALDGAPGPYSARFGGPGLDDRGRVEALLAKLLAIPAPRRARFRCVAVCAAPDGRTVEAEGICEGEILLAASGQGGFGYDPIFRAEGESRSMAEMSREEKDALSHRGRAVRALAPGIESLLSRGASD